MKPLAKKTTISLALLLTFHSLSPTHKASITVQNPYKILLPMSIVFFGISGLAATYCYSKEQQLIQTLDALREELQENSDLFGHQIQHLQTEFTQKISLFKASKFTFCVVAAASLISTVASGILLLRWNNFTSGKKPSADPEPTPGANQPVTDQAALIKSTCRQESITQKTVLAQTLQQNIRNLQNSITHAKDFETRLQSSRSALAKTKDDLKKNNLPLNQSEEWIKPAHRMWLEQANKRIDLQFQQIAIGEKSSEQGKRKLKEKFDKISDLLDKYEEIEIDPDMLPEEAKEAFEQQNKMISNYIESQKQVLCDYLNN